MRYVTIALLAMALPALANATSNQGGQRPGLSGQNWSDGNHISNQPGYRFALHYNQGLNLNAPNKSGGTGGYDGLTPGGNGSWNASPFR